MSKIIQTPSMKGTTNGVNTTAVGVSASSNSEIDDVVPTRERFFINNNYDI